MAEELLANVRQYYERVDARDLDGVLALFHPEVVYERGGRPAIHGIEELRRFFEQKRMIREGRHDLLDILVDQDRVAVRGRFDGIPKNGEPVSVRFADFHYFKDGLIWRRYSYFMDRFV